MDRIYYITMLYDFYSELLTEKQRSVMERYYLDDLSLNEVAEEHDISRQAVHDMIKRTEHILQQYEDKLSLVAKYVDRKKRVEDIIALIDSMEPNDRLKEIRERVSSILE